jgi:protein-tyrosine phosphatase
VSEVRVLFVCYGNSCRSPLAEGIFRDKVSRAGLDRRVAADSAGTHAPGAGQPPHPLARRVANRHGLDIDDLRVRRFDAADFDRFDRIVVMDSMNRDDLLAHARDDRDRAKVRLLRDTDGDVPDPISGGEEKYEQAFSQIDEACERLLGDVRGDLSAGAEPARRARPSPRQPPPF